ncbi:MAG: hypothetical protein GY754_11285 [bacterium]|nr:hypothetical protein [bacterium]
MAIGKSGKMILITRHDNLVIPIQEALDQHELSIAIGYPNLSSIEAIQESIQAGKNTTFIRTELLRFMKENGFPHIIALDYRIDSGLGNELDPDKMKVLRTFLISYIILSRGKGFEKLIGNFLILASGSDVEAVKNFELNPERILDILATKDKIVNSFILELKNNIGQFKKLFFINTINTGLDSGKVTSIVANFAQGIKVRENLRNRKKEVPKLERDEYKPGKVLCRFGEDKIYIAGEHISPVPEEYSSLMNNEFYIHGNWTNKTLLDVSKQLSKAITGGLGGIKKFKPGERITINLGEECTVDQSTAVSMAQLLARELSIYTDIEIIVEEENLVILQEASGFNMIRKVVQKMY